MHASRLRIELGCGHGHGNENENENGLAEPFMTLSLAMTMLEKGREKWKWKQLSSVGKGSSVLNAECMYICFVCVLYACASVHVPRYESVVCRKRIHCTTNWTNSTQLCSAPLATRIQPNSLVHFWSLTSLVSTSDEFACLLVLLRSRSCFMCFFNTIQIQVYSDFVHIFWHWKNQRILNIRF